LFFFVYFQPLPRRLARKQLGCAVAVYHQKPAAAGMQYARAGQMTEDLDRCAAVWASTHPASSDLF
jgi:hypothetical protein